MGQKVHPTGIRLGIVKDWSSKWYADSHTFPEYVRTDHQLRQLDVELLRDDVHVGEAFDKRDLVAV